MSRDVLIEWIIYWLSVVGVVACVGLGAWAVVSGRWVNATTFAVLIGTFTLLAVGARVRMGTWRQLEEMERR